MISAPATPLKSPGPRDHRWWCRSPVRSCRVSILRPAGSSSTRRPGSSMNRRGGGAGPLIDLSPRGRPLDQEHVRELAAGPGVRLLCGRFEGVDERLLEARAVEEVSLGDFVLSGGEPAAIALIDACVRLLPGVVGCAEALAEESFAEGLFEYPHYTRPQLWQGRAVPEVLVSGDHAKIRTWRRAEAERLTRERRPDLWQHYAARLAASGKR